MRAAKLSMLLALALASAGCASATPEPTITPVNFRACQLSQRADTDFQADTEQVTYALQKAQIALGAHLYRASAPISGASTAGVFEPLVRRGCNLIVTTGDTLATLARGAAMAHQNVKFLAVVSAASSVAMGVMVPSNYSTIHFDVTNAGYLAGYAAAASSKTGFVGAIAGIASNRTKQYLSGFAAGVAHFNESQAASVRLLGSSNGKWDFLGTTADAAKVQAAATDLVDQGADVLFLAAGPASVGAGAVAALRETKLIFTDSDAWFDPATTDFKGHILTSAKVNLVAAVFADAAGLLAKPAVGMPSAYLGNLANGGVELAPTHDLSFSVSLGNQLEELTKTLVAAEEGQK